MKISELSQYFSRVESTSLRNEKTEILASMLKSLDKDELSGAIYISLGRLGPLYDTREFNLAEKMVLRAVAYSSGRALTDVEKESKETGDIGDLVEAMGYGRDENLSVGDAYQILLTVAEDEGVGSQERKVRKLGSLLQRIDPVSGKYLSRLVVGKLRLGFSDVTVLDALSTAVVGDKSDRTLLEHAFNVSADIAKIAGMYLSRERDELAKMTITPGVPIRPAKAERLGSIREITEKLGKMSVEPKYDGMRLQIHAYHRDIKEKRSGLFDEEEVATIVKIYSRGMEDISHMFPDIVEEVRRITEERSVEIVLDSEAIGVDLKTGEFLPFQETIKRKRKHKIADMSSEIPMRVYAFDLLYMNEDMLGEPYAERRNKLGSLLKGERVIVAAESHIVDNESEAKKLLSRYIEDGLEGMMCKRLDSVYQAGARSFNWVKYKKAHDKDLADTLDCVVMGYYVGKGKRQKFGLGAFLVGVSDGGSFKTVAKIGTGLTDQLWEEMYARAQKVRVDNKPQEYEVPKGLYPDYWVTPKIVVEIEADEITKSPIHSSGYALRFPRLIRFRDDKGVSDITNADEVSRIK